MISSLKYFNFDSKYKVSIDFSLFLFIELYLMIHLLLEVLHSFPFAF